MNEVLSGIFIDIVQMEWRMEKPQFGSFFLFTVLLSNAESGEASK